MARIDISIQNVDKTICQNIDLIDFETVSRALVSQNLLSQSRNLVEHIVVPHMEQLPGYNMDAFREEYRNVQILRRMLEEFRKNNSIKD